MKNQRFLYGVLLASTFLVAACSSGPKFNKNNQPAGGTRFELAYQIAQGMANQGYCSQAMPIFVCLASLGSGWEVAAGRAGQCAPLAAQFGQTLDDAPHQTEKSDDHRGKNRALDIRFDFQDSPEATLAEGTRQLRRAANANWPEAQALLIEQLVGSNNEDDLVEARLWLGRYDKNARRKVYGGNVVSRDIRMTLKTEFPIDDTWVSSNFAAEDLQNPGCNRLLGVHGGPTHVVAPEPEIDDGLERIKPRKPGNSHDEGTRQSAPEQGHH